MKEPLSTYLMYYLPSLKPDDAEKFTWRKTLILVFLDILLSMVMLLGLIFLLAAIDPFLPLLLSVLFPVGAGVNPFLAIFALVVILVVCSRAAMIVIWNRRVAGLRSSGS